MEGEREVGGRLGFGVAAACEELLDVVLLAGGRAGGSV